MSNWKNRLRSSGSMNSEMASSDESSAICNTSFMLQMSEALDDEDIVKKFQRIMSPLLSPIKDALDQANSTFASLQKQMQEKDLVITNLQTKVSDLEISLDDQEQQGRRGSMRLFGVPEVTSGTLDDKVLAVCNGLMKVCPKLTIEDLEVVHRVGKPPPSTSDTHDDHGDADQNAALDHTPPRPILVKFSSRRTKARVMKNKKKLKDNPYVCPDGTLSPVYVADDLTKQRANLAYRARLLRRSGSITDTWTFDSKILVKTLHGRIKPVMNEDDLNKLGS